MFFFYSTAALTAKVKAMKSAEDTLMEYAKQFGNRDDGDYDMQLIDTKIPSHAIPLSDNKSTASLNQLSSVVVTEAETSSDDDSSSLTIHGVRVDNKRRNFKTAKVTTNTPLVLLHGYGNSCLYFYRNLVGLSRYFNTIYSLDSLGWGLSSRPKYVLTDNTTETTEEFFVESLEAWRKANNIPKMILAGHSMGGYMSVAYCEKYPQHVERLVLLSPAGVPNENEEFLKRREQFRQRMTSSWSGKAIFAMLPTLFDGGYTPCSVLRSVPESTGLGWVQGYVQRRLPAIATEEEQTTIANYLYHNATLPGSAEYALNRVLRMDVMGRKPLESRICHLKVPQVTLLYGDNDWMDSSGGLAAERACRHQDAPTTAPQVDVLEVPKAGHLLMLDNWAAVNSGIIVGGLGLTNLIQQAPLVLSKEDMAVLPRKLDAGAVTEKRDQFTAPSNYDDNGSVQRRTSVSVQA